MNVASRHCPAVSGHPVGAQAALLPDHVWHRLGSGFAASAGGPGRRLPQRPGRNSWRPWVRTSCLFFPDGFRPWRETCNPARPITSLTKTTSRFANEARTLRFVSPVINREDIRAVSDYGSTNGQVFGVAPDYNQIRNVPLVPAAGSKTRTTTEHRRVAVVGWELLKNVFPGRPAVGATMLLNGVSFDIIGVLAKVGQDGNNGTNARIFIPIETMRDLFPLKKENSERRDFIHQLPAAEQSRAPAVERGDSPDHRAPPWLRSQAGRCLRRLGHH